MTNCLREFLATNAIQGTVMRRYGLTVSLVASATKKLTRGHVYWHANTKMAIVRIFCIVT